MKKILGIFNKDNYRLKEYHYNTNSYIDTNRIKFQYVDENEVVLAVDMTGKDLPAVVEATFFFNENLTGDLTIHATQEQSGALSCMEVCTRNNEIGRDVRVYMGKFCVEVPLRDDNRITFKFTAYSNRDRAGSIRIKCI